MKFKETLFILGAGSHVPYGFPSSDELKNNMMDFLEIIEKYSYEALSAQSLKNGPFFSSGKGSKLVLQNYANIVRADPRDILNPILSFLSNFRESRSQSIDLFLQHSKNKNEIAMGAKLIAIFIRLHEKMHWPVREFNWIEFLLNRYLSKRDALESFLDGPPSFLTFNYDRFLEQTFYCFLSKTHRIPANEAWGMVAKLKIHHIYGTCGTLNGYYGVPDLKFDSSEIESILDCSVETVTDDCIGSKKDELTDFAVGKKSAVILGFAFDPRNLTIISDILRAKNCFSTNYGLNTVDKNHLHREYQIQFIKEHVPIDCLNLFQDHIYFEN